jgi:uncharacterized protein
MRIAIIGAGVSGLTCAYLLHREHDVTVYEAGSYAGGHTNTIGVETDDGAHQVDTGFIVMNDRNYPTFTRLLDRIEVQTQPTHMSFSVRAEDQDFEYSGTPRGLFSQPQNIVSPQFLRMIADLLRFNREMRRVLAEDETGQSLAGFLSEHKFSRAFVERLIVPQAAAVWSADPSQMSSFPVRFLGEFFANHGMLGFRDRPQWSTVVGGSARYVEALTHPFRDRIRLNCAVRSITRLADYVEVVPRGGSLERYDQVVVATHSDQALEILSDPSTHESRLLGAIAYQTNEAVLHTDSRLLPRRRAVRAAWNYHLLSQPKPLPTVTYYMNHLQRIDSSTDFCVTLNHSEAINPSKIIRTISYSHPVYTPEAVSAQREHHAISRFENRTHYCGAYWGWGFHEDGVLSAVRACAPFGVTL